MPKWLNIALFTAIVVFLLCMILSSKIGAASEARWRSAEASYLHQKTTLKIDNCVRLTGRYANMIDGRIYTDNSSMRYWKACMEE